MLFQITLTAAGGLSVPQIGVLTDYFHKNCKRGYIVNEFGDAGGNSHLQGIVEFETDKTSNVTERIKRQYEIMKVDVVAGITIKIKKVVHLVGALIYASKELKDEGNVVFLEGWEQSWIDKQVKDNVKMIPYKMLKGKGTRVTQGTGGALIYEWCRANNSHIQSKLGYLEVVRLMGAKGFLFGSTRHIGLYADVCALFGQGNAAYNVAESELRFID